MKAQVEPLFIIGALGDYPVVTAAAVADDPLVKVELRPGVFIKMRTSAARAQGLLPEEKAQPPAPNKARRGARNKARGGGDAGE